jgi:hypothetical protein
LKTAWLRLTGKRRLSALSRMRSRGVGTRAQAAAWREEVLTPRLPPPAIGLSNQSALEAQFGYQH